MRHSHVFTREGKWPSIQYRGFQDMRYAALDVNIPNYANAIMATKEIVASLSSLQAVAAVLYLERRTALAERIVLFRRTEGAIDSAAG